MDGRKRLSGAEYRKLAEAKKKKENEVIAQTLKLDTFFKKHSVAATGRREENTDKTNGNDGTFVNSVSKNNTNNNDDAAEQPSTSHKCLEEQINNFSEADLSDEVCLPKSSKTNISIISNDPFYWEITRLKIILLKMVLIKIEIKGLKIPREFILKQIDC